MSSRREHRLDDAASALDSLRVRRFSRRMQRMDRFDAFYRAYVTALAGGMFVLLLSEWIGGTPLRAPRSSLAVDGAALLGLLSAIAIAAGIRSGSRGGPLSLEAPDVRHVVLSPVPRSVSLRPPALRQLRFLAATAAATGGIAGQLASHRLPGHALAWTATGALWATVTATAGVSAGWIVAGSRTSRTVATGLAAALLGTGAAEVLGALPTSPTHGFGLLGVLPLGANLAALVLVPALTLFALSVGQRRLGRTSVERLSRRSALVGELRFAATMRDLRTVMLLRRQLHQERPRNTPWIRTRRRGGRTVVIARDWRALLRTPATRVVRVVALAVAAATAAAGAWNGTTALIAVAGVCAFLVGLEVLEPLAQEIDRCTVLDLAPVTKGEILVRHLIVPTCVVAVLSAVVALSILPFTAAEHTRVVVFTVAAVAPLAAVAGAAINVLRDGRGPGAHAVEQLTLPPEAVGMRHLYRLAWPPAVSTAGFLPVVMANKALENGADVVGAATTAAVFVIMLAAAVATWVRYCDELQDRLAAASSQPMSIPKGSAP